MNVTRVLRASLSRVHGSVMSELFAARERACASQRVAGLHGALMHASGWFLLWLEGRDEAVDAVLARSAPHPCHAEPRVIHRSTGAATLTEPLTLATTQWPESPAEFARRIAAAAGERPELEPGEIWRRLSQPCTIAANEPARRVALVATDDMRSMDLVRKLAERFRAAMVYQRYATSELGTRDVGAAYVDLPIAGEPVRVQMVSRLALAHDTVRESLKGVDEVAVLLGSRPDAAMQLVDSIADFVPGHDVPRIALAGPCADTARSAAEYASNKWPGACTPLTETTDARLIDRLFGRAA